MQNKLLVNLLIITILTPAIPASSSAALLDEIIGFNLGTPKRPVIEPKPLDLAKEGNNKITDRRQYIEDDEDEEIDADEFDGPEEAAHGAKINNDLAAQEKAEGAVADLTEKVRLATEEANRAKAAYDAISTLRHPIDKLRAKGAFDEAQKKLRILTRN